MIRSNKLMNDNICLVTGATSGMGEGTARALAQRGAAVIIVSRNAEKCAATVNHIKQQTGNPAIEFMVADLSSQKDICRVSGNPSFLLI